MGSPEPIPSARVPYDSVEPPTLVNLDNASSDPMAPSGASRYRAHHELGRGGMGVVRLCRDGRIGRDVAMKVLRPESQERKDRAARFLREARVQGQLEHPGILPVYDVGADETGAMFFTMKRLNGMTLGQIIKGLREGDPAILAAYSRRKLLTAFSSLCLTVDYAHSRGVLHRDIKPANVMLGDFGEVYLLDWGIAKLLDTPAGKLDMSGTSDSQATVPGELLGTPGYIAPEQAWGQNERLDARADVYALGSILFEMLARKPLHPRGDVLKVLRSTTDGVDARPSARSPELDVPPELDEICVKATARERTKRYPSARALHEAVERFLDGDRNVELRHTLASEHAASAEAAVEKALSAVGQTAEDERRTALREVGRALAFDPTNERALAAMNAVFTAPPREVPAEVTAELEAIEGSRLRFQLRKASIAELAGAVLTLPALLWMGLQSFTLYAWLLVATLVAIAFKLVAAQRAPGLASGRLLYVAFVFNTIATLTAARAWGPVLVMPVLLVTFAYGYASTPWPRYRRRVMVTAIAVQIGASAAELFGLWPRSYEFANGAMTLLPRAVTHSEVPTVVGLTTFVLFMLIMPLRIVGRTQDALRETETKALLQSWQLRQLLPPPARRSAPAAAPRGPAPAGA